MKTGKNCHFLAAPCRCIKFKLFPAFERTQNLQKLENNFWNKSWNLTLEYSCHILEISRNFQNLTESLKFILQGERQICAKFDRRKASWYMTFSNETIFTGISNVSAAIKFNKLFGNGGFLRPNFNMLFVNKGRPLTTKAEARYIEITHANLHLFTKQFETLGLLTQYVN